MAVLLADWMDCVTEAPLAVGWAVSKDDLWGDNSALSWVDTTAGLRAACMAFWRVVSWVDVMVENLALRRAADWALIWVVVTADC